MASIENCLLNYDLSKGKYLDLKGAGNDTTVELKNSFLLKVPFFGRLYRKWVISPKFSAVVEWLLNYKSDLIRSNKEISQKLKNSIQHYYRNNRNGAHWEHVKDVFKKTWPQKTVNREEVAAPIKPVEPEQPKETHKEWVARFQKEHCIMPQDILNLFYGELKMTEELAAELKGLLRQYPTLKFYFSFLVGVRPDVGTKHFYESMRQLNDEDICIIIPFSTMYSCQIAKNQQVNGKEFFFWNTFVRNGGDRVMSIDPDLRPGGEMEHVYNQRIDNLGRLKAHLANPENIKKYKASLAAIKKES